MSRFYLPALATLALTLTAFLPADKSAEHIKAENPDSFSLSRMEVIHINNSLLMHSPGDNYITVIDTIPCASVGYTESFDVLTWTYVDCNTCSKARGKAEPKAAGKCAKERKVSL